MAKEKTLTEKERALIDHEAQINGPKDPRNTLLSDGRSLAEAQAAHVRADEAWEAERQKRKASQARERELSRKAAEAPPPPPQKQDGGKTTAVKQ